MFLYFTGQKSDDPRHPDYTPSLFNFTKPPEKRKQIIALDHYERRDAREKRRKEHVRRSNAASALLDLSGELESQLEPSAASSKPSWDCVNSHCHEMFEKYSSLQNKHDQLAEKLKSIEAEYKALREENQLLKLKANSFSFDEIAFQNDDEKVKNLTGLPSFAKLVVILNVISPHLKLNCSLPPFQQFLLTLMRMRSNCTLAFLGYIFGVSESTISRLFNSTLNVMYDVLVPALILWPEREQVRKTLPMVFRTHEFRKCVSIIDCFEIFIEKPNLPLARAETYSSYKHHNTMKYLISATPQGTISYISDGYGGRASDKFITEHCGYLNNIAHGDLILADRGFNVHEAVGSQLGQLYIPAFTKGKQQLDPIDIEKTRKIAQVRIHVERVIGAVRNKYTILQSTVHSSLLTCKEDNDAMPLDKIVKVCCALTNVCPSVVPKE